MALSASIYVPLKKGSSPKNSLILIPILNPFFRILIEIFIANTNPLDPYTLHALTIFPLPIEEREGVRGEGSSKFILEKDGNWSRMDFGGELWRGIHSRGMPKA